jgi:transposase
MQGKDSLERSAKLKVYAGIDVCKAWLDVCVDPAGQVVRIQNNVKGFKKLIKLLATANVSHVVMEPTGKYHRGVHQALHDHRFLVCLVNPARARYFAKSIGVQAKTDRIDAKLLAAMGGLHSLEAVAPSSELLEGLQELIRARQASVDHRTALSNQLRETTGRLIRRQLAGLLKRLEANIKELDAEIRRRINGDPATAHRYAIVRSIKGVGAVAAAWLAIVVPELGSCSNKQAAMLVGLAPIACDSGEKKGQREIKGGRADVRRGIYMAAWSAANTNPTLTPFYQRLRAAGKLRKVAITAVMRKLVVLANTLLREDRQWQPFAPKVA